MLLLNCELLCHFHLYVVSSGLSFFIPSDNSVKIAMSCSLTVALYVLQQSVARMLPSTPTMPTLSIGLMIELGLGCYTVMCAVVTVALRAIQPPLCSCCVKLAERLEPFILCATRGNPAKVAHSSQSDPIPGAIQELEATRSTDGCDKLDRLANAIVDLTHSVALLVQKSDNQQAAQSEQARHWKVIDALLNFVLFVVYVVVGTLSCVFYLFCK